MSLSRRRFLRTLTAAGVAAWAAPLAAARRESLAERFADLRRHFVFEYYPWYETAPYRHWDQAGRNPPLDLASNYMPRLGAYDSRDRAVMEQHARWIADSGVGAINVSWWGPGSDSDRLVPSLMDVMRAHDVHVTFHLEPYGPRHAVDYARDIEYLITEYGERRRWDALLLLQDADGTSGPLFKSFATILPSTAVDCHGVRAPVAGFTADDVWRRQTDRVRELFRGEFDRVTLLADSLDMGRTRAGGFDGIAIYDNFVEPDTWRRHAEAASARDLLFSFNVNPGYDAIVERQVAADSCYAPLPFKPGGAAYDWTRASEREAAARASERRIADSFRTTIRLQRDPLLSNAGRGFLLVYVNSFNEWHEGHQFEPMQDAGGLTPAQRAVGYHNPVDGSYRLSRLRELLSTIDD